MIDSQNSWLGTRHNLQNQINALWHELDNRMKVYKTSEYDMTASSCYPNTEIFIEYCIFCIIIDNSTVSI